MACRLETETTSCRRPAAPRPYRDWSWPPEIRHEVEKVAVLNSAKDAGLGFVERADQNQVFIGNSDLTLSRYVVYRALTIKQNERRWLKPPLGRKNLTS